MTLPLWVAELAAAFWAEAGTVEAFPRNLRGSITRAFPLSVVYLPRLHLEGIRDWLRRNDIPWSWYDSDRALRGCLFARSGSGLIFLDGMDPEDEQRFSLAHELAHFLRDYWHVRRLACRRLGKQILEVFDGKRPPTTEERFDALLAHVSIGFHVHLLHREEDGHYGGSEVLTAEEDADRLAYELLAPAQSVITALVETKTDVAGVAGLLQEAYGLPQRPAADYGNLLVSPRSVRHPLLQQLGLSTEILSNFDR